MKRFFKTLSSFTMVILILAASILPSFAAGAAVNGEAVKKNDVVTYELLLADCEEPVVGFQMYIKYDKEYLEMVENSLAFPELSGSVVHNGSNQVNSDDGIIFNYSNVQTPDDFSTSKVFATVDFKVIKEGETNIEFFVADLFGMDMTYMKSYTFTYNLFVNDNPLIEGEPPILVDDQDFLNENQGQFINYADGKGEVNGKADNNTPRETVMGVTTAPSTPIDVLKGAEESSSFDLTTIIVLIAVILIVLIIVVLVIVRNALNRSKKEAMSLASDKEEENRQKTEE